LVFVHGFLDSAASWTPLIHALRPYGIDGVAWDLAGAGARRDEPGPFTLARAADDVAARLCMLDANAICLVGHSMGAQIAELVAQRVPKRIQGLLLMTPTPLQGNTLPDAVRDMLRESGGNADAQRTIRNNFSHHLSEDMLARSVAADQLMGVAAVRGYYDAFTTGTPEGYAACLFDGPTLVLGAADDPVIPPALVQEIHAARFAHAQLAFIDGSGHWPQQEQVARTAESLHAFVSAHLGQAEGGAAAARE
jgi:pimeloyl-ACP methyl ester carboxylesterase